ncbi:hypothetical protein ERC79_01285 [Rhodococcus sp. ABRD24]|uniref:hypothetical protein n=1 Tax=Rhodococcus sp. ABRD24 TaxID=2507582 RepID=UPI00103D1CAC|nr:hypothetical protein [Rhodococcus sp. ABRD24]QBJ94748.1 hypothetical protein ERC79_01285 [Rhodococcus sp. ABRD24]
MSTDDTTPEEAQETKRRRAIRRAELKAARKAEYWARKLAAAEAAGPEQFARAQREYENARAMSKSVRAAGLSLLPPDPE